jgi:peroxiredoxin Q/BCP
MAKPNTRASAKKKAGKKQAAGKKKPAAKKKAAAKKPAAKKPAAKKKAAAKKPAAKKPAAKKPAAKKKAAAKKATAKKATSKKATAKKATAKKATSKKAAQQGAAKPAGEERALAKSSAGGKRVGEKPAQAKPEPSTVEMDVGSPAPSFDLQGDDGQRRSLSELAGQRFVLYFYPRDNTPGCTTEAKEFSDLAENFEELGVRVFGVSTDTLQSHVKFRDKHGLKVGLLADPDAVVARAYGAWGSKLMYGKPVVGMIRTTFVIGPDGKIERKYVVRQAGGHAAQVLEDIDAALENGSSEGGRPAVTAGEASDPQSDQDEDDSPEDEAVAEPDAESDDDLDDPSNDDLP